jgi:beta-1,4-mannosyl-glycoprotein beta-1,4-N-acetylglucosaminyltransferase
MKIYDCITYCGEDLLLNLRFETLNNYVDKFVIIEGNKYFNGEKKPKFFDLKKFNKFKNKIDYFFIEDFPEYRGDNYLYEHYQRDQIKRGLGGLAPDDIVILSDADEIPNLKNKNFMKYDSTIFLQNMYYYKLNIHFYQGLKWNNKSAGTKCCKYKFFTSGQNIRNFRVKNIPWWRFDQKMKRYVEFDGGWHFAFLMNINEISEKLARFDHEIKHLHKEKNFNSKILIDEKKIKERMENFRDPYERNDVKLRKVKIDESYPEFVRNNLKLFSNYII